MRFLRLRYPHQEAVHAGYVDLGEVGFPSTLSKTSLGSLAPVSASRSKTGTTTVPPPACSG